ncbi:MAG TPA: hypothetical protein VFU36_08190, partial [Jatrophihabitans sp.]|nr:hypothetical protein [Jatrophihabitans sp.]
TAGRSTPSSAVTVPGPALRNNGQPNGQPGSGHPNAGLAGGPQQRPYIAPGDAIGPPDPAVPPGVDCAQLLPGGQLTIGSAVRIRLATVDHDLYLYDFLCVLSDTRRSASTVAVYARVAGRLQLQSVLVPAVQGDQVDYMGSSDGARVLAVQLFTGGRALIREDFTTADGVHFTPTNYPVAPACLPSDLTVRIARVDSISSAVRQRPYAVQLTKQSAGICVLSGYLGVTAADGTAATPTLRGAAGGWGGRVPPIVQLGQGTTVSAMIEPAERPKCAPSGTVAVSLPGGMPVGTLPAGIALCGAQLHPIVSGSRGSS